MTGISRTRLMAALVALCLPPGLAAQGTRPETHTVRTGDTLWGLARTYLSDPLLWPEIYRLNTAVVEDPHWIYPGEVLRLAAGADVAAVPSVDTPPPAPADAEAQAEAGEPAEAGVLADAQQDAADDEPAMPALAEPQFNDYTQAPEGTRDSLDLSVLVGDRRRATAGPSLEMVLERGYRSVHLPEFYSSGMLSEDKALPYGRLLGVVTPLQIEEVTNRSVARLFQRVAILPPAGAKYQVGDTLLSIIVEREIRGFGRVLLPTGLLRVVDVSRPENLAEVISEYGPIRDGQSVLPAERFTDPGNARAVPISDGVRARVLDSRDRQPLKAPQDVVFLDRGRSDGVALGDVFDLHQRPHARVEAASVVDDLLASVVVVHVGDHSATARIIRLMLPEIPPGTEARQVAKLPS